jgi:hypothetical protein
LFAGSSELYTTVEVETVIDGNLQSCYSRDYFTEGVVILAVPELEEAVVGSRVYYRCAVAPLSSSSSSYIRFLDPSLRLRPLCPSIPQGLVESLEPLSLTAPYQ